MTPPGANVPLADKTSFRIGGPARFYAEPATIREITALVQWARRNNQPLCVLGRGTNILISDEGWNGLVLNLSVNFSKSRWRGNSVTAQAGALLHTLVMQSIRKGLKGIERLAGIPGTVGGAAIMNAGAFDQEISSCIEWVRFLSLPGGPVCRLSARELCYGYRRSALQSLPALVLSVHCRFSKGTPGELASAARNILECRREKQPLDLPNCGSVFKRPEGRYAGKLIEQAGLKGHRTGDAQISPRHANFIVNLGAATAADVRRLIAHVQKRVYENSGVLLEPEVLFIGDFDEPLFGPQPRPPGPGPS
jgi:UDP-N-acetylmuramate dehydrogenase